MSKIFKVGDKVYFTNSEYVHFNCYEMQISSVVDNKRVWLEIENCPTHKLLLAKTEDLTTNFREVLSNAPSFIKQDASAFKYVAENGYTEEMIVQELYGPKCECGSEAVGIDKHSDWCGAKGD